MKGINSIEIKIHYSLSLKSNKHGMITVSQIHLITIPLLAMYSIIDRRGKI